MRLLIKQRVFSWTDSYDVYDENENPKYFVKAEFFSLGHQLHVYDRNNHELGVIRQRLLTFLPAFEIEIGGRVRGEIRKQFSFFNCSNNVSSSTRIPIEEISRALCSGSYQNRISPFSVQSS